MTASGSTFSESTGVDSGPKMASRRADTVEGVKEAFEAALKATLISNRGSATDTQDEGGGMGDS